MPAQFHMPYQPDLERLLLERLVPGRVCSGRLKAVRRGVDETS